MPTDITPLEARRQEVDQYQANIDMYQTLLDTLPSEWPDRLAQHRGRTDHQQAAAEVDSLEDVALLGDLLFREQCEGSIRAELVEQRKAAAILAVLQAQQT
jgi:hypothetical protein